METKKKLEKTVTRTFQAIAVTTMLLLNLNCSKNDDEPNTSIEAKTQTFTLNGVNNCSTSSGDGSTFVMKIPYSATTETAISRLRIKTVVSDGGGDESVNTKFTDENNTIIWATCFRFGSQDWVEYEVVLEADDGLKSNPSKVRVNKPNGAN